MNRIEKSVSIKTGLRKGFQDGSSKMARRRRYGYSTALDGNLTVNCAEAEIVRWIFQRYLEGDSLGKIAACFLMKNTQAGSCSKKPSAQVFHKLIMMAL